MTIHTGVQGVVATNVGIFSFFQSTDAAIRLLYAVRLIGALLVATLVPLLIDRRLRR